MIINQRIFAFASSLGWVVFYQSFENLKAKIIDATNFLEIHFWLNKLFIHICLESTTNNLIYTNCYGWNFKAHASFTHLSSNNNNSRVTASILDFFSDRHLIDVKVDQSETILILESSCATNFTEISLSKKQCGGIPWTETFTIIAAGFRHKNRQMDKFPNYCLIYSKSNRSGQEFVNVLLRHDPIICPNIFPVARRMDSFLETSGHAGL